MGEVVLDTVVALDLVLVVVALDMVVALDTVVVLATAVLDSVEEEVEMMMVMRAMIPLSSLIDVVDKEGGGSMYLKIQYCKTKRITYNRTTLTNILLVQTHSMTFIIYKILI